MLGPNRFYRGEFVDPWALGVLAYELVVGDTPFYVADENENSRGDGTGFVGSSRGPQDDAIMAPSNTTANGRSSSLRKKKTTVDRIFDNIRNFRELELPFDEAVDEDYVDLVHGFLQVEPMHRRLAGDCLNHAFFQKGSSSNHHHRGDGSSSAAGQKENIMQTLHHDSLTAPPPTVAQRCERWNKQKTFERWPASEQEI
jgi:serine/threonine protein kinase